MYRCAYVCLKSDARSRQSSEIHSGGEEARRFRGTLGASGGADEWRDLSCVWLEGGGKLSSLKLDYTAS